MKIFLIVEGDSDGTLLKGQLIWFASLGLDVTIVRTGGKKEMIRSAMKHYKIARLCGANAVIFLPDQNSDECALVTRRRIGMDGLERATTIVMKCELEAWILADGQCVQACICMQYSPAGQTDTEVDPKQKLQTQLKRKYGYLPTGLEAANIVAPHFSIHRAARNNTSAKRFKEFIESILSNCGIN